MTEPDLTRVLDVLLAMAIDRSTSVVPVPGGVAVLNADFPFAHDHNQLIVSSPCDPVALLAAADDVLGGAGLPHRRIHVLDSILGRELAGPLRGRGYGLSRELLMTAKAPPTRPGSMLPVVELDLPERAAVASAEWRRERPDWSDDGVDQLGRRIRTVLSAASEVHFLAIRDDAGRVVSHADLYLRDGVAQIEEVITHPAHQGQGLASALVLTAVERARAAGADPVFLNADGDDWPQKLYRRLGFTDLATTLTFAA